MFARKAKMVNTAFTQFSHTMANKKKSAHLRQLFCCSKGEVNS